MLVYVALVFGIFGLVAYVGEESLKKRITALERQLTNMQGTSFAEERRSLIEMARSYIGQQVQIKLKEDDGDVDIMMYGNSKYGSNTILDVDQDWMLVRVAGPKWTKEKLIRLESIERITLEKE
jgi:hypothetical protein